jgi:hypothetical protein
LVSTDLKDQNKIIKVQINNNIVKKPLLLPVIKFTNR